MEKWFRRLVRISIVAIYLVIIAGSVVRMSGSGMGCPDWPKCFGYLIPPTEESQVLWKENHAFEKGQMIVREEALWVAQKDFTSEQEWNSENWKIYDKHDYAIFNPVHTWTEYINRLFGAFSGIPALLTLAFSFLYWKKNKWISFLAFGALLMLGFEAWLGKVVVDGNLIPGQITIHMVGAFILIFLYTRILSIVEEGKVDINSKNPRRILMIALFLLAIQVVSGTQVRELVDQLYHEIPRVNWIEHLDWKFKFHRSFANALIILSVFSFMEYRKNTGLKVLLYLPILVVIEVLSGVGLNYLGMPAAIQPLHLLLSAILFGTITYHLGRFRWSSK